MPKRGTISLLELALYTKTLSVVGRRIEESLGATLDATDPAATDWWQILQLYNQLQSVAPSPVVALNRAVAVAEVEGPDAALTLVGGLELDGYHLFHALRAEFLRRLGRNAEAALAYEAAIARAENAAERDFLQRRRQAVTDLE